MTILLLNFPTFWRGTPFQPRPSTEVGFMEKWRTAPNPVWSLPESMLYIQQTCRRTFRHTHHPETNIHTVKHGGGSIMNVVMISDLPSWCLYRRSLTYLQEKSECFRLLFGFHRWIGVVIACKSLKIKKMVCIQEGITGKSSVIVCL